MNDSPGARAFSAIPLTGSPAGRLCEGTARDLAAGRVARCPHPGEPAFWHLAAAVLACGRCLDEIMRGSAARDDRCDVCGDTASAVAGWVTGGVPCIASLCGTCGSDGLVPLAPN